VRWLKSPYSPYTLRVQYHGIAQLKAQRNPWKEGRRMHKEVLGRTWADVFMALVARKKALITTLVAVVLLTTWVHLQTAPGDRVELFGMPLWKKSATPSPSSAGMPASPSAPVLPPAAGTAHASDSTRSEPKAAAPTAPPNKVRTDSNPGAVARQPYAISLPSPREFVIGPKDLTGRYMLLSATVSPQTPESDALTIQVRVMSMALPGFGVVFTQASFGLLVDGSPPLEPQRRFTENVASGKSMDEDVVFIIRPGLSRAKLRIQNFNDRVDVPLDLSSGASAP
jgi:hypothetical protein